MTSGVDVNALLPLVQDRPMLWFKKDPNYRNHKLSEAAWLDICKQLYPSSDLQTSDIISKVKAKWTRVRDCFKKAQKRHEKHGSSPEDYVHFEKMKFLLKNTQPNELSAPVDPDAKTVFNENIQPNYNDNIFETNATPTSRPLSRNNQVQKSLFAQLKEKHINENVQPTMETNVEGHVNNDIARPHDNPAWGLPQVQEETQQGSPPKRFKATHSTTEIKGEEDGNHNIPSTSNNSFNVSIKTLVEEEDISTAIIPATYPDVKLTEEQGNAIEHAILEQLQPMEDGSYPVFSGTYMERGALIINCSNDMTRLWLDKLAKENFMPLGETVKLEVISRDDVKPNKVSFTAPDKLSTWTPEQIIDKLDKQNRSLKIDEWNLISTLNKPEAYIFVFSINDECLDAIKSRQCMVHLGLWKVLLTIPVDLDAVV